jgi:hypothetical protein
MACRAGVMGGPGPRSRLPHGDVTAGPIGPAVMRLPSACGVADLVPSNHPPVQAGPAPPARPKSFVYHFAAQALLTLI